MRMYSATNTEVPERPNRISGYVWNLAGGLGSGAYFQDPVKVNQWIMVTLVLDDRRVTVYGPMDTSPYTKTGCCAVR